MYRSCITRSPLPTPRITPVEAVTLTRGRAKQDERNVGHDIPVPTSANEVPQATTAQLQVPTDAIQPLNSIVPSNGPELQPISALMPPAHYPPIQSQEAPPPTPGYSMDLRAFVDFLSQHSDPRIGAQYAPLALATAMSGGTWPWVPPPEQNARANPPQIMNAHGHHLDPSSLPNAYSPSVGHSMQPADFQYQDNLPFSTLLASIHPQSHVASLSSPEAQISKVKKRSRAGSTGYRLSSAESSSAPHCTSVSRQPSTQRGTLFTSDTGRELSFFIQVDLKDRQPVLNAIKVRIFVMFICI